MGFSRSGGGGERGFLNSLLAHGKQPLTLQLRPLVASPIAFEPHSSPFLTAITLNVVELFSWFDVCISFVSRLLRCCPLFRWFQQRVEDFGGHFDRFMLIEGHFFSGFEVFYGECWRCVGILWSILADANRILQILSSFWVILAKRWWFWRDLLSILISFYRFLVIFWVWRCFYGECWRCVGIWWSILVDLNRTLQILSSFWVIWANDWRFRWIFVELFNRFRCF